MYTSKNTAVFICISCSTQKSKTFFFNSEKIVYEHELLEIFLIKEEHFKTETYFG